MKKEILNAKKTIKEMEELKKIVNNLFGIKKMDGEAIKMLDLIFNIEDKSLYLNVFKDELENEDIKEAEKKYNIKRVNEHLEKILEEYTKLTDELDAIIFEEEKEC